MAFSLSWKLKNFLGEDQSFFFEVVTDLFSDDTGVRDPADSLFQAAMEEYTDVLATRLLVAIRRSPEKVRRFRCLTLLRRFLGGKWPHIHLSFQERCKGFLVQLLRREEEWDILKVLCACMSSIASQQCEWPELVDIMFEWLSPNTKSVAGILFSQIIPIPKWFDTFRPAADHLGLAFNSILEEASEDNRTKTAIAGAAAKLMLHFHTPNHLELLTGVISVLGGPDAVYDEDLALSALDALNILGREKPELFTRHIMSLANEWLPLKMNNEYMRHLIVKLFITVGEGGDQNREMIRNFPSYAIEELFTQLLHVIWVEGDISWDVHEMDAGKMPMPCYAEHTLRRLAMVLGQDLVVSCLANLLPNYFNDNDWKKRYAGVISLGLIAPSLIPSKVLVRNLKQYVKKTVELIIHDRVLSVCCTALYTFCEFSKWLKPYFQEECHEEVIPALLKAMNDSVNPRLQTYAALAMSTFCQNGCSDIFKPYLDEMVTELRMLLETSGKTVEAALSVLASLAESAKDDFRSLGDTVIDKLNDLRSKEVSNRMLVAKILHCITVVELAVGKSVVDVEKTIMALQSEIIVADTDDQVKCVLLQALAELCRKYSSEDNFLPYLNAFMLSLIEAAKLEEDHWDCQQQDIIVRKISSAIHTMSYIVIQGGIYMWASEVLDVVSPIANFEFIDKEVRVFAISVMPELLRSAVTALENEHIVTLANKTMIPRLIEALEAPYLEVQLQALVALNKIMEIATTRSPDDNQAIIESVLMVLSECFTFKRDRELILAKYGKDFREPELAKEEDDVCKEVLKCLKFLIERLYKRNVIPKIDYVNNMWQKDGALEERSMALKIFTEIALKCREQGVRQYAEGIPLLLEFCKGPNPDIQQIAAGAIGIYAEFGRETFKQHLQDGLSSLDFILQHPDEHLIAREAAVCAYGKVCFFLREEINSYENIDHWLVHLPIRRGTAEAKVAHELLCSMVDYMLNTRDDKDGYFKRIIPIIVEVLWIGNSIAEEETKGKMNQQLKMFKEKVPRDEFIDVWNSLPQPLQNTLRNSLLHTSS